MNLKLKTVKENIKIQNFIKQTEKYLDALSYTDHGFRHINIVADRARSLAKSIGLNQKDQELSAIAGYCHDMANFLGRTYHHYMGALLFSQIFLNQTENTDDISTIMQAITSHDKNELKIVNKVTAILILADKSDVRRSRVITKDTNKIKADIHNRVNFATKMSRLKIDKKKKRITLVLKIDNSFVPIMEYFEIFTDRMVYCRKAARYLNYDFGLVINNFKLL